jgi:hypothetical protein
MESNFIVSLRVTRPRQKDSDYRLEFLVSEDKKACGHLARKDIEPHIHAIRSKASLDVLSQEFSDAATALATKIPDPAIVDLIHSVVKESLLKGAQVELRLEIIPEELFALPWEKLRDYPPWLDLPGLEIVRYSPVPADSAFRRLEIPISVFLAGLGGTGGDIKPDHYHIFCPGSSLSYFQTTALNRLDFETLRSHLKSSRFNVIHLRGRAVWSPEGQGALQGSNPYELIRSDDLRPLLRTSQTWLCILEAKGYSPAPLLDLAQRLLGRSGPAVLAVYSEPHVFDSQSWLFFNEFYFSIVHDEPLNRGLETALNKVPIKPYVVLGYAQGGENALRISRASIRLLAQAKRYFHQIEVTAEPLLDESVFHRAIDFETCAEARGLEERVMIGRGKKLGTAFRARAKARVALPSAAEWTDQIRSFLQVEPPHVRGFLHEAWGMEPLTEVRAYVEKSRKILSGIAPLTDRVVNVWFSEDKADIPPSKTLVAGENYDFTLQIGARSFRSIVGRPKALPEEELYRREGKKELDLRVVLFSDDFIIDSPEKTLWLPLPPQASDELTFAVKAPSRPGMAHLRACVYYQQNLLQSLWVSAEISKSGRERPQPALSAEVEFALSTSLKDIGRYKERVINILTNRNPDGTHTFAVVGTGLREHFHLTEGEMRAGIKDARRGLQAVCSTIGKDGKPIKYQYDKDNRGSEARFVADLILLASSGYDLYANLVIHKNQEFKQKLDESLRVPKRVIQVAATQSSKYVFPWALVYDKGLSGETDKLQVCPQFLDDLRGGGDPGFLENQICLSQGCPNGEKLQTVCPSGFWGFRHIIEQPLSAYQERGDGSFDLILEIPKAEATSLLMAACEDFELLTSHKQDITSLGSVDYRDSLLAISGGLRRQDLRVVYFYCHGSRSESQKSWLVVGKDERFYPRDLLAWDIAWENCHPLVFINGCHTADVTPDDLIPFNDMLAYCRASGVIGTEISITERLASQFGLGFLKDFLQGTSAGEVIRRQRLRLLEKYNPLGLVYTPYCSADLHLA